jgi:hypothetical protein
MIALYIIGTIVGGVALYFVWRGRNGWPSLPAWSWHDIRKLVALAFTIMGAAVVTLMAWWLLDELVIMAKGLISEFLKPGANPPEEVGTVLEKVIDVLAWGLKLLLAGSLIVLLSLGFAINPRSFEFAGPGGIRGGFRGGDSEPPAVEAAKEVAKAADDKADEIAAKATDLPDYAK